jgi:hypothetical protein
MRLRTLLALALATASLVIAGPAAEAVAYPPTICPTISVSTTTPLVGETITVAGVNFTPGAKVRIELNANPKVYVLANVTASATGTFSTPVTFPAGVTGTNTIRAVGGGGGPGCPANAIQVIKLHNGGESSSNGGGTNNNGGGGTAFTGVDVLLLLLIAALLVGAGVMLNRGGGRRRRQVYPGELG